MNEDEAQLVANDSGEVVDNAPTDQTPSQPEDTEDAVLVDNDQPAEAPETAGDGDGSDAGQSGDDADGTEQSPETPAETTEPGDNLPRPSRPEPVADPGAEYVPSGSYGFDVTLADGTTLRIDTEADLDKLPDDFNFSSNAEAARFQMNLSKMATGQEQERREWEASKAAYDAQIEQQQQAEQLVTSMVNEITYLQGEGRLPKIDPKYENANWSDPEIAKQPGVKDVLDLIAYRNQQNVKRTAYNLPPMSFIEAQMSMQSEAASQRQTEAKTRQNEQRKRAGAMVGGSSGGVVPNTPEGYIVVD